MRVLKESLKYIVLFCGVAALLTGLLVLSAIIPRSAIQKHAEESAQYLCEKDVFFDLVKGADGSRIDRYADSILLAIAYQYDVERPLDSVMWSAYYYTEYQNENQNFLDAVTEGCEANTQYLRYWHGANAVVRPFLTFLNLKQIYLLNGVVLAALIVALFVILIKNRVYVPAIGVAAGLIMTAVWFVPFSLEYTWTYILMLIISVIGVSLAFHNKYKSLGILFMLSGMVTAYADFLTTETLTLTVPLLLVLWIAYRRQAQNMWQRPFLSVGKSVAAWGLGYAGMWAMKWVIASVVLSENVLPYVSEHIGERAGISYGIGIFKYIFAGIWRNIRCIFPWEYGVFGVIAGIVIVGAFAYTLYVYRSKKPDWRSALVFILIGLVPYVRYAVLVNHSYLHYFFTYRAQMATVVAAVFVLDCLTNRREALHGKRGRA